MTLFIDVYLSLSKCYKGLYPFNIGMTSFIYPVDFVPGVKMQAPSAKGKFD